MNIVYQEPIEAAIRYPTVANTVYQSVVETARNTIQYLHVTGAIFNNKIDGHVVSYKRLSSLCNPGAKITLNLDSSFPGPVDPGMPVSIYERGVKVLTGYVIKSSRSRPAYDWTVDIDDAYMRVTNYFLSEKMDYDTPQSAKFLIGEILDQTGVDYIVHGTDVTVPPGTSIGLRSAHDALSDIMVYGSWYAWADVDGVVHIKKHVFNYNKVIRDPIAINHVNSTEQTRNVVKVYGRIMADNSAVNLSLSKDVPGLVTDLVTVVANPLISNYDDADRVGSYILQELGSQTNVINFTIEGDPSIQIGTSGSLYYQDPITGLVTSGSGPITSLESKVDQSGYIMDVTIGERCPRISGWSVDPRELRCIWIAAVGGVGDPRPWKVVRAEDFGAGGQPTYYILSDIPSGSIQAMHVTRNGRRVYLLMRVQSSAMPNASDTLWYSDDPYSRVPTWSKLIGSGDSVSDLPVDFCLFNNSPFMSMQMVGNTLWFSVRVILGNAGSYIHLFCKVIDQSESISSSYSPRPQFGLFHVMGSGYYYATNSGGIIDFFKIRTVDDVAWTIPDFPSFDIALYNGVSRTGSSFTGNWWNNDLDETVVYYTDNTGNHIRKNKYPVLALSPNKIEAKTTWIRGDYWGGQVQFVDGDGNLYVGNPSFTQVFQWRTTPENSSGIVVCLDKSNPSILGWFPRVNDNANEVARYSRDGGKTWINMTGNWWGSRADVVAKRKMQSDGGFELIDAHPTFWSSEAPSALV